MKEPRLAEAIGAEIFIDTWAMSNPAIVTYRPGGARHGCARSGIGGIGHRPGIDEYFRADGLGQPRGCFNLADPLSGAWIPAFSRRKAVCSVERPRPPHHNTVLSSNNII